MDKYINRVLNQKFPFTNAECKYAIICQLRYPAWYFVYLLHGIFTLISDFWTKNHHMST